jgi:hypothetical protein
MATAGQFYWPSVGIFVAAYGQFFMAANIRPLHRAFHRAGLTYMASTLTLRDQSACSAGAVIDRLTGGCRRHRLS